MRIDELEIIARRLALRLRTSMNSPISWEDVAQEGLIYGWNLIKKGETRRGILIYAMRREMIRYLVKAKEFKHHNTETLVVVDPVDFAGHNLDEAVFDSDRDLTYHQREIFKVLRGLTPGQRRYVFHRFWLDKRDVDMIEVFGYRPGSIWVDKNTGARARLRKELDHLKEIINGN